MLASLSVKKFTQTFAFLWWKYHLRTKHDQRLPHWVTSLTEAIRLCSLSAPRLKECRVTCRKQWKVKSLTVTEWWFTRHILTFSVILLLYFAVLMHRLYGYDSAPYGADLLISLFFVEGLLRVYWMLFACFVLLHKSCGRNYDIFHTFLQMIYGKC